MRLTAPATASPDSSVDTLLPIGTPLAYPVPLLVAMTIGILSLGLPRRNP